MATTTSLNTHIKKYVGEYADNDDFKFQEELRQTDLAIRVLVASKSSNSHKVNAFGDKGWGQVIGVLSFRKKSKSFKNF